MTIEAVTFDHWNTLVYEDAGALRDTRLEAWLGILEGVGFATERERLDAAFASSWQKFLASWQAHEQYTAVEAAVDVVEELGYELPPGVHDELVAAYTSIDGERSLHLCDHVADTLDALKTRGVKLGIICDVGMTPSTALRANLEREGVLRYFDHWSFSDDVGAYKPSPVIFHHALDGLGGIEPSRAAHGGDLRRTDIAGALDLGITAVRYTGGFDDVGEEASSLPDGDHVISDHRQLLEVLDLPN
ncbi:MAG TPA: HAD family hydrolase [Acidimicrobiales bacterium]|nr:HAD family hydrolase [Acidimicrobiales bacterium]